ncbi:MAG: type IV secretion system protein, partial [Rhodopila sp.]
MSDAVQGPATAGATLYILWTGYKALYLGDSGNPILDLVRACMRVVLVMGCLSVATYTGTFTQLLLTTLPTELAQAVTGAGTVGAGAFDTLATAAFTSTVQNLNNLPVSLKSIPLGFFDILYLLGAGVAIVIAFALWLIVQVGIGLLVAVGPLAIACLITPQTARFFHGWLSSIVTALVAQVMIVATVAVMVVTIKSTLGQVLTVNAATGKNANDVIGQILSMLGAGMAFGLLTLVCLNINRFASAIG